MKCAILIDGGFYRKRAKSLFGKKTPQERATEIFNYALARLKQEGVAVEGWLLAVEGLRFAEG